MIPKPAGCRGCPLYGDGQGFVPDRGVEGAQVLILAQNPGADEEHGRRLVQYVGRDKVYEPVTPQPLIGATGYALEHHYLPRAGLQREQVSTANVLKCRYQHTNALPPAPVLHTATAHCTAQHLRIPASTTVIVAHGQEAWDYATGTTGLPITRWRGYALPRGHGWVYATLHTAAVFRAPSLKPVAEADWSRLRALLAGTWPTPVPSFLQVPHEEPLDSPRVAALLTALPRVAVDTEFTWSERAVPGDYPLTVIGLGGRVDGVWQGVQVDCRVLSAQDVAWWLARYYTPLVAATPVLFQNAGADVPVLQRAGGPAWEGYTHYDDLMLLHSALYSEQPHDLEYLASIAGCLPKLKHLAGHDLLRYNLGDVVETYHCFEVFEPEGRRDEGVWRMYTEELLPLVPIHTRATQCGLRVNRQRVAGLLEYELGVLKTATAMAWASAGWPINLGSVGSTGQLATYLYQVLGLPRQLNRATGRVSVDTDAVAALRRKLGPPPDTDAEAKDGLSVEQARRRIDAGADPVLEARVIYAAVLQEVTHYLAPLVRTPDAQ
jgi:uracil-DNA glycosylase family 4